MKDRTRNVIPREFFRLIGEMQIDTNMDKNGDILHVTKCECGTGYLAYNLRTGKYAQIFSSMLRNAEVFRLVSVEK